ncbi:MAG: alanine racemase [Clostridia bacterium]|nr:alanine racemase [Clostridia bacterium]
MQKVKAVINLSNIRQNAKTFLEHSKRLCAVVKANAYGHGAEEIALALSDIADLFATAILDEAIAIRHAVCGKDILVFAPPLTEEDAYEIAVNGFIGSVTSLYSARVFVRVSQKYRLPIKVHLKVNTGMNRYGMRPQELGKVCKLFATQKQIQVQGIYSHLYACAFEQAEIQREKFLRAVALCKCYFPTVIAHLSATYGAMLGERYTFDMTRVGLGLYGYLPISKRENGVVWLPALKKGMQVFAPVMESRVYQSGGAGYGTPKSINAGERICLCRYGYADGFLRNSKNGSELESAHLNNLCMDACVCKGERKRGEYLPVMLDAEKTASKTGTIAYEVLCAATRRAEFVYEK